MRLVALLLGEAARAGDGRLFIHAGGMNQISAPQLPWSEQVAIAARFVPEAGADFVQRELHIAITGPDGDPVENFSMQIAPASSHADVSEGLEELAGINVAVTISPLTVRSYGAHHVALRLGDDEEPIGRELLLVVEAPVSD